MRRKEPVPVFSRRAPKQHDEAEISSDEEIKMHRVSQKGTNDQQIEMRGVAKHEECFNEYQNYQKREITPDAQIMH